MFCFQGNSTVVRKINDTDDFIAVRKALKVLGFSSEETEVSDTYRVCIREYSCPVYIYIDSEKKSGRTLIGRQTVYLFKASYLN